MTTPIPAATPAPAGSRSPTDTDRLVGENLRRIRIDRNETLSETGAAVGISHQQLQKYETGSNRLSAGMLKKVADHFSVSVADLFDAPDAPVKAAPVPPSILAHARAAHASLGKILEGARHG